MKFLRMHVAINVTNLEENLKFYRVFFDAEPTKVKENYAKFELSNPPLHFSMNVRPYDKKGALNHLGFQVENTQGVMAVRERLQKAGLMPIDEMGTTCCYAVQDKIWVHDPEGNAWEVFYTKADSEFESAGDPAVPGVCCQPPSADSKGGCCSTLSSERIGIEERKKIIYFLCTGNSCRSQMAEGFGKKYLADRFEVYSAGIEAHGLNPLAVKAMREKGIDISGQTSDVIDPELLNRADYVVTLCGDANDKCPMTPPHVTREHWGVEDPAKAVGTEEQKWQVFQRVRDEIEEKIKAFAKKQEV